MKEMCRNFLCNNNQHPRPATSPEQCNACVRNHIGLAQAYVPAQTYGTPKEQEQSLVCGTVFSELSMPYCSGWNLYRFRKGV